MWELDHKEGWALKNWCFRIVVLEKTTESPLYSKDIKPVHPKGNQPWIFIGRTVAEAEAPILWPPDVKNWLIGKHPDAGKDWRQEEKGTTEDEMVGWHHRFNGHKFVLALVASDGQGSLSCYSHLGNPVAQSCLTLCEPMDYSTPGFPVPHQLPKLTQTHVHWVGDAIQPSHPLSSPSFAFNLSQDQGLFKWVSSSYQGAKVLEFQLQQQSFQWIFKTDFL